MRDNILVEIQEPWWGAYTTFKWAKGIWGIGINKNIVDKAIGEKKNLSILIKKSIKDRFIISPVTVKNYAEKNRTTFKARNNVELYVIPHNLMRVEK